MFLFSIVVPLFSFSLRSEKINRLHSIFIFHGRSTMSGKNSTLIFSWGKRKQICSEKVPIKQQSDEHENKDEIVWNWSSIIFDDTFFFVLITPASNRQAYRIEQKRGAAGQSSRLFASLTRCSIVMLDETIITITTTSAGDIPTSLYVQAED